MDDRARGVAGRRSHLDILDDLGGWDVPADGLAELRRRPRQRIRYRPDQQQCHDGEHDDSERVFQDDPLVR